MNIWAVMIVKNEEDIVAESVRALRETGLFSRVLVVDTGSTDATTSEAEAAGATVMHAPWEGFGKTRTAALRVAEDMGAEWMLMVDCDDRINWQGFPYIDPDPGYDGFTLDVEYGELRYRRPHLFRAGKGWRYEGAVHEAAITPESVHVGHLEGVKVLCNVVDSARDRDQEKFKNDALALEAELKERPTMRGVFYAGQSWFDYALHQAPTEEARTEALHRAIGFYEARRVRADVFPEEAFYAALKLARCLENLGDDPSGAYLQAYSMRPTRAEPLYALARFSRLKGRLPAARVFAETAHELNGPPRGDVLFVEGDAYGWPFFDELAVARWHTGDLDGAREAAEHALYLCPKDHPDRARLVKNLELCK